MNRVQLLFTKKMNVGSWVIRAGTMSPWSHVGVLYGDWLIEATAKYGVRAVKHTQVTREADAYAIGEIPSKATQSQVFHACMTQCGKPYDFGAVLGMPFWRDWQEDDKWFCSELVEWGFAVNHANNFPESKLHRVTPRDLWMLTR